MTTKKMINLGSGPNKIKGYINVDDYQKYKPDILTNLNQDFPFENESTSHIIAYNILEHVNNPIHFLNECHRILIPSGEITIGVPSYKETTAYLPQHKTIFSRKWFTLGFEEEYHTLLPFQIDRIKFIFGKKHRYINTIQKKHNPNDLEYILEETLDKIYQIKPNWTERLLWHMGYEIWLTKKQ